MEEQSQQSNKYVAYIKNNKYTIFFLAALAILIVMIIAMVALVISVPKKTSKKLPSTQIITPSQLPSVSVSPSVPSVLPLVTPNPTEAASIESQTQPQISPYIAVPYTVPQIKKYNNAWAIMQISNPDVGTATVIEKKINGSWKVILGPGTYFSPDELQSAGVPQQLLSNFYSTPSVSPAP